MKKWQIRLLTLSMTVYCLLIPGQFAKAAPPTFSGSFQTNSNETAIVRVNPNGTFVQEKVTSLPRATNCSLPAPNLNAPINGVMVNTLVPLFEWFKTSTDIYAIAISTVSDFSTIIYASTITFSAGYPSNPYSFGLKTNLSPNTTYYWRVASACAIGSVGAYSPTASFRTGNITGPFISPPSMIAPADGAVVSSSPVTFSWGNVTGATGWQIRFYQTLSDAQADLYFVLVWTNTWYNSWTQYFGTTGTYYWRILAKDARAWGSLSPIRSFTVGGNPRLPIVFVTGWNAIVPDPSCKEADPQTSWAKEIADLEAHGWQIFYARLISSFCYTPRLRDNAFVLRNAIANATTKTGQKKVILIAHSMGGIVSRAYIEDNDLYKNDVDTLFTLGSPHWGLPFRAYDLFAAYGAMPVVDWKKNQLVADELSLEGMTEFNKDHKKRSGVNYHFIAGDAPDSSRNLPGLLAKQFLAPPNDVAIPTISARGELVSADIGRSAEIDRMTTDEVHSVELGPHDYFVRIENNQEGLSQNYTLCIKPVLNKQISTCSGSSTRRSSSPISIADLPSTLTPIDYGTIFPGQTVTRTIVADGGSTLFATSWQTGTLDVKLVDPNGLIIDSTYAAANPTIVSYSATDTLATYDFPTAVSGEWKVMLQGTGLPAGGTAFANFASINNGLTLAVQTDRAWYVPGAIATITATISGPPSAAGVTAKITTANGVTETIAFSSIGGGQYRGTYSVPNIAGYAQVNVKGFGTTSSGLAFQRETNALFQIASNRSQLSGIYSDTLEPRMPGSSLYSALVVNVGINSSAEGPVGLSADLVDLSGNFVAHGNTFPTVSTGSSILNLRFQGIEIFASKRNGPYRLTNLLLTDRKDVTLAMVEATNVYTTAAYNYLNFAESANYFPFIRK